MCIRDSLDRLLGVGGMAAVYAATHRNGSRAAVKLLHRELSVDAEINQRFLREGYVANAIDHPGVVRALDDDRDDDGSVFLVLELLEGEPLDARQRRLGGRLPVDEAILLVDQLLSVLAVAHARGVVHRDIKPENLFLRADSVLKLLDFGIARLRDGSASATHTGTTMGTPAFMAPEQALGESKNIGPRTDLWAVGATLFTLLSGRYVHDGNNPNALLVAAATRHAPSLASFLPGAPEGLGSAVDRALAFRPDDRWADASAMQTALRQAYQAMAGAEASTGQAAPQARQPIPKVWTGSAVELSVRPHPLANKDVSEDDTTSVLAQGRRRVEIVAYTQWEPYIRVRARIIEEPVSYTHLTLPTSDLV